jgi:hypothetical protein
MPASIALSQASRRSGPSSDTFGGVAVTALTGVTAWQLDLESENVSATRIAHAAILVFAATIFVIVIAAIWWGRIWIWVATAFAHTHFHNLAHANHAAAEEYVHAVRVGDRIEPHLIPCVQSNYTAIYSGNYLPAKSNEFPPLVSSLTAVSHYAAKRLSRQHNHTAITAFYQHVKWLKTI